MKKAILAKKIGMTQIFTENGTMVPVTVLEAGPCLVVQKKTQKKEGYNALQIGFGDTKARRVNKPLKGHYEAQLGRNGPPPKRILRELRLENTDQFEVGAEIKADIFKAGERVDVSGISKGKGFQGTIKRYGGGRGPMSHGSKYHRGLGAMSANTDPGKVPKGRKMPGHMGAERITVQNLKVVRADAEKNVLLIKGAVPGVKGAILLVKNTVKE